MKPTVKNRVLFVKSPQPHMVVWSHAFYTRGEGADMMCLMNGNTRSDSADVFYRRCSADNGQTWSEWEPIEQFMVRTPQGVHRQYPRIGWVDPGTGRLIVLVNDGVLPTDNPLEGMKHWSLVYRVSTDGGQTFGVDERVIQKGDYTAEHPMAGVWVGKNSVMIGAKPCVPIRTRCGHILAPVCITPTGRDGEYHNPGGGLSYHDAAVLVGRWADDLKIEWELSERVAADPEKCTRGCDEPTLAELPDGRILMVIRGSNDVKPDVPGHKWHSVSEDGGYHWSEPSPWTYNDGTKFFSPSSCSQFLMHSNGRIYWLGNICPANPRGNSPRYPLVIGEVDQDGLTLIRESLVSVDTRGADDADSLQLSNFFAHEDRQSHEIVVYMTRFLPRGKDQWQGDSYVYRILL